MNQFDKLYILAERLANIWSQILGDTLSNPVGFDRARAVSQLEKLANKNNLTFKNVNSIMSDHLDKNINPDVARFSERFMRYSNIIDKWTPYKFKQDYEKYKEHPLKYGNRNAPYEEQVKKHIMQAVRSWKQFGLEDTTANTYGKIRRYIQYKNGTYYDNLSRNVERTNKTNEYGYFLDLRDKSKGFDNNDLIKEHYILSVLNFSRQIFLKAQWHPLNYRYKNKGVDIDEQEAYIKNLRFFNKHSRPKNFAGWMNKVRDKNPPGILRSPSFRIFNWLLIIGLDVWYGDDDGFMLWKESEFALMINSSTMISISQILDEFDANGSYTTIQKIVNNLREAHFDYHIVKSEVLHARAMELKKKKEKK